MGVLCNLFEGGLAQGYYGYQLSTKKNKAKNAEITEPLVWFHSPVSLLHVLESEIKEIIEEDNLNFGKVEDNIGAIGLMRIIPERVLSVMEQMFFYFISCQKDFDHVNWMKLPGIL